MQDIDGDHVPFVPLLAGNGEKDHYQGDDGEKDAVQIRHPGRHLDAEQLGCTGNQQFRDEKQQYQHVIVSLQPVDDHPSPADTGQQDQPSEQKPEIHPCYKSEGQQYEQDAVIPRQLFVSPPDRLPDEEQAEVNDHQRPGERTAEIDPESEVDRLQHQYQQNQLLSLSQGLHQRSHGIPIIWPGVL